MFRSTTRDNAQFLLVDGIKSHLGGFYSPNTDAKECNTVKKDSSGRNHHIVNKVWLIYRLAFGPAPKDQSSEDCSLIGRLTMSL